ncbi:MAG: ABC transporter permease [Anaerolineae bacterium]
MSSSFRNFIITRLLLTIPMILILVTLVFFVMRILPGDPIRSQLGPKVSEEQAAQLRERMGLNRPLYVQYFDFLWRMITLDFGNALTQGERPIREELAEKLPATIELTIPAILFTALTGIYGGAFAAQNRKKPVDYTLRVLSVVVYAFPVFFLGLLFQIIFAVRIPLFPLAGRMDAMLMTTFEPVTNFYIVDAILNQNWAALKSTLMHLVLPSFTLGLILAGPFLRLTRVNMLEVLQSDFITAGRARGLPEKQLVYKHALRNTFIPIITLLGLQFALLLAGAVLTETTFSWPGMGRYLVKRIELRDYNAVQSVIAVFALFVGGVSVLVDILYAFIDPRIRY